MMLVIQCKEGGIHAIVKCAQTSKIAVTGHGLQEKNHL